MKITLERELTDVLIDWWRHVTNVERNEKKADLIKKMLKINDKIEKMEE